MHVILWYIDYTCHASTCHLRMDYTCHALTYYPRIYYMSFCHRLNVILVLALSLFHFTCTNIWFFLISNAKYLKLFFKWWCLRLNLKWGTILLDRCCGVSNIFSTRNQASRSMPFDSRHFFFFLISNLAYKPLGFS